MQQNDDQMGTFEAQVFEILTHGYHAPYAVVSKLSKRIAAIVPSLALEAKSAKAFSHDRRAQAAVLADLPESVAQEAGDFYEGFGAANNSKIKKSVAMAEAWSGVIRPYLLGLRDHSVSQARPALEANQQVIEALKAEHRAQMADMSERFREVNVTEALRQMGNDKQVIETLRAAAQRLIKAVEDVDLGRSIHNDRKPDQRIEGNVWVELMKASRALGAALPTQPEPTRGQSDENA